MGTRATLPSTVNLRIPAERRSLPADEGRGAVEPPQDLQPKHERAAYREKGISIKDLQLDLNRPFQAGDPSHSPSNPSPRGKEKEGLGKTPGGDHIRSLHEQSLNAGKNVMLGECSKPAASPLGSSEPPDDHPMKQEEGSLLHTSFLVLLAHGRMSIDELADYLDTVYTRAPTRKFPDNWWNDLEYHLLSNRHFLRRKRIFTVCKDLGQPPSEETVNKKMEPSVVIGGQDKNPAERSHGMSTEGKVQVRTPPSNFAVRTPRLPIAKPSNEDIDRTSSVEKLEQPAQRRGRRGQRGPSSSQSRRASEPEERNSGAPLPIATVLQKCAKIAEIRDECWRCNLNAVQGELYCTAHMEQLMSHQLQKLRNQK